MRHRTFATNSFPAHFSREIVQVDIPEDFKKRVESGEIIIVRESIRESLKFVPSKLVVVLCNVWLDTRLLENSLPDLVGP